MTVLGFVSGTFFPDIAQNFHIFSDCFLKLISMISAPLIFCVLVQGIAGAGNLRTIGRLGVKALSYFEIMTSIALGFGLLAAVIFQPGTGLTLPIQQSAQTPPVAGKTLNGGFASFLLHLIPLNPIDAFGRNDILQVVVFAMIFGCAMVLAGKEAEPVVRFVNSLGSILFQIMGFIIRLAPLGVFGATSYTIGHYGLFSIIPLLKFLIIYFISVLFFVFIILGFTLKVFCKINIFSLLSYLKEEMLIVLATTSSDAVLPAIMKKLINLGVGSKTVGIVIPAGYSFNLDALSIYIGLSILFLSQAAHVALSWKELLSVIFTALLTSKGAHGVPGMAIVILTATLSMVPEIPGVGIILLVSVDWFIGIARAFGNITGNCVATCVIAKLEKDQNEQQVHEILSSSNIKSVSFASLTSALKNVSHGSAEGE